MDCYIEGTMVPTNNSTAIYKLESVLRYLVRQQPISLADVSQAEDNSFDIIQAAIQVLVADRNLKLIVNRCK